MVILSGVVALSPADSSPPNSFGVKRLHETGRDMVVTNGKRVLRRAFAAGQWVDLKGKELAADVVRDMCRRPDAIDPRGLLIRRAVIRGQLDLSGMVIPVPLRFDDCEFGETVNLEGAELRSLALVDCRLKAGLLGNGVQVTQDLDVSGSHVTGALSSLRTPWRSAALWLCQGQIGGSLLGVGTEVHTDGLRAVHADWLNVGGSVRLIDGFVAEGMVRLLGARVGGSVDLKGAQVGRPGALSLDLENAEIGGNLFLIGDSTGRGPVVLGRIDMVSARVGGRMLVRDTVIGTVGAKPPRTPYLNARHTGTAINGTRAVVDGDISFEGACRVNGGIDLSLGEFGHVMVGEDCVLSAPGETALDLSNADLRSSLVLRAGVRLSGTLRVDGAAIKGRLVLRGVRLDQPENNSLVAARAVQVAGDVELQNLQTVGGAVNFRGAVLGSVLDAGGAMLVNPEGVALRLHQAQVRGSVRLVAGFDARGSVDLTRCAVEGRVDFRGGAFDGGQNDAIIAEAVVAKGGLYLGWTKATPRAVFTDGRTSILADDAGSWQTELVVRGLIYERFGPLDGNSQAGWRGKERSQWLSAQPDFDPGAYEQAANVFRQHGNAAAAEQLLMSQRRQAMVAAVRQSTGLAHGRQRVRAVVDRLYGIFGYGYRPGRAGWPLVVLLAAVAVVCSLPFGADTMRATDPRGNVYAPTGRIVTVQTESVQPEPWRDPCGDGQVRCFNAFVFAVDTVVPLVSLGQRSTWYANPHTARGRFTAWFLDIATLLGWALSSILALSATRLARNL